MLATSIAETSITIEGVRVVIDSGLARVPRYEPDVGLTRLETVRVSRAAADQRRGRAGRTEPGVCYRLWDEPQTGSLEPYTRPEILSADLSSFALDLAQWGAADTGQLAFLDAPPQAALNEAKTLLSELGAIDEKGRITDEGRTAAALAAAAATGAHGGGCGGARRGRNVPLQIAAILTERGLGGNDVDLGHRLENFQRDRSRRAEDARAMVRRWAADGRQQEEGRRSILPARSSRWPIPTASPGVAGAAVVHFLLANGRGGIIDPASSLAREPFLAVAELAGAAAAGRIVLAAPITLEEIEATFRRSDRRSRVCDLRRDVRLAARATCPPARRIDFAEQTRPVAPDSESARLLAEGIAALGVARLPWSKAQLQLRDRVKFLRRAEGDEWPDLSDASAGQHGGRMAGAIPHRKNFTVANRRRTILPPRSTALLPWNLRKRLDAEAPTHFTAPSGSQVPIDYEAEGGPKLSIRVQELFGLARASHDRRRARAAAHRTAVAGASAGADDARSARILARQLQGCEDGSARPLSEASVARRSVDGAGNASRQAARPIATIVVNRLTARSPCVKARAAILHPLSHL